MDRLLKNKMIKDAIKATRSRRKEMQCKTFRFKIDLSSLSKEQKNSLKMYFIETKRLYNYILNNMNETHIIPKTGDYKQFKNISYLDKDKNRIDYTLQYIGSSVISDTITILNDSIKGLSASKKKGRKVGALKFKSECNSVRLRQYGVTHTIKGNRIKIQGIKKPIRVNGLKQLRGYDNIEYAMANLIYDGYDYFISIICYVPKENNISRDGIIGIDLGCESTVTISNGAKIKITIEESERLKRLQARLATQKKRSNNWYKTKSLIRKEYNHITNKKNDASNKIVHYLSSYKTIVIQDDDISGWHDKDGLSRTVQHSVIGRIKSKLKMKDNVIVLDKWFPTTKHCFKCNNDVSLELSDRVFKCPHCGCEMDRDVHAACNMIEYYNIYKTLNPTCIGSMSKFNPAGTVGSMPRGMITYKSYKNYLEQEALRSLVSE